MKEPDPDLILKPRFSPNNLQLINQRKNISLSKLRLIHLQRVHTSKSTPRLTYHEPPCSYRFLNKYCAQKYKIFISYLCATKSDKNTVFRATVVDTYTNIQISKLNQGPTGNRESYEL